MYNRELEMARKIALEAEGAGGRAYFVGGFVRDALLKKENKDIDLEIHGLPYEELKRLLGRLGTPLTFGASFGVFALRGYDLDIALPRKEKATGRGHKDFEIFTDPFIGPEKAASRRDFTINAMLQDVLSGELLDFFGGKEDLEKGIIRHVMEESFVEDPLRVLRAAQFSARFGFSVCEETVELCSKMELSALSRERVLEELKKALLKAEKPSDFFGVLEEMNQLGFWFEEVRLPLEGLDEAAAKKDKAEKPFAFMLSALCVPMGDGGESFLRRLTNERELINYVLNMKKLLPRLEELNATGNSSAEFAFLFDEACCPEDLLLLSGREQELESALGYYREIIKTPGVTGGDLINAGAAPGESFKAALKLARQLQLSGEEKEEALSKTLDYLLRK